jgi:hypothetical protein
VRARCLNPEPYKPRDLNPSTPQPLISQVSTPIPANSWSPILTLGGQNLTVGNIVPVELVCEQVMQKNQDGGRSVGVWECKAVCNGQTFVVRLFVV